MFNKKLLGLSLITTYEKMFGFILFLLGFMFILSPNNLGIGPKGTLGVAINSFYVFIFGLILISLGVCGISGSILFLRWKKSGYTLSLIFLILTGILIFIFFLIPSIILFISLIYFFTNEDFKNAKKNLW